MCAPIFHLTNPNLAIPKLTLPLTFSFILKCDTVGVAHLKYFKTSKYTIDPGYFDLLKRLSNASMDKDLNNYGNGDFDANI